MRLVRLTSSACDAGAWPSPAADACPLSGGAMPRSELVARYPGIGDIPCVKDGMAAWLREGQLRPNADEAPRSPQLRGHPSDLADKPPGRCTR